MLHGQTDYPDCRAALSCRSRRLPWTLGRKLRYCPRQPGILPDGTRQEVWEQWLPDHKYRDTPRRLDFPSSWSVRGRYPPPGRPHFFSQTFMHLCARRATRLACRWHVCRGLSDPNCGPLQRVSCGRASRFPVGSTCFSDGEEWAPPRR